VRAAVTSQARPPDARRMGRTDGSAQPVADPPEPPRHQESCAIDGATVLVATDTRPARRPWVKASLHRPRLVWWPWGLAAHSSAATAGVGPAATGDKEELP
jgi:hypothetical protein